MTVVHLIGLVVAGMAATLHVAFFVLESVLFRLPAGKKIFGVRPENDSATLRLFAVNQGIYNLALAIVVILGIVIEIATSTSPIGVAIIIAGCSVMVVAGIALAATAPRRTIPIALAQGGLALVAIIALLLG
jgi:putative membrane protein